MGGRGALVLQGATKEQHGKLIDDGGRDGEIGDTLGIQRGARLDPDQGIVAILGQRGGEILIAQFAIRRIEQLGHAARCLLRKRA